MLIFGGLFVFGHIMGILRSEFATIGGFLMGTGGIINGLFLRLEMKKEKDSNNIIQKSSMLYQKSIASFVGGGIILLAMILFIL